MSVTIDVRKSKGETRIIDIVGDIDIYTSGHLNSVLTDLFDNQHFRLIVNLERTRSIDSTGLAVLIGALKRGLANDGGLDLICVNPLIRKTLEITGLAKAFSVFGDEHAALTAPIKGATVLRARLA